MFSLLFHSQQHEAELARLNELLAAEEREVESAAAANEKLIARFSSHTTTLVCFGVLRPNSFVFATENSC